MQRSAPTPHLLPALLVAASLFIEAAAGAVPPTVTPAPVRPARAEDETGAAAGIDWHDDLLAAQLAAEQSGRPVALYVRSELCDSCDKLLEETLVDERVLQAAGAFTWVLHDKNVNKEELAPFNVFAFPSILVLGPKNENVHRFDGFRAPDEFLKELDEALSRYERFEKGEAWDTPRPRPATLLTGIPSGAIDSLPINEIGHGVTFVEDKLFVVQQRNLFGFDTGTLDWKTSFPLPSAQIRDLCTDGTLIYALPWGWTKGDPILALDPANGQTVLRIVTERNKKQRHSSAQGIEWFQGELYVLADRGRIYAIDPVSGEIRISMQVDLPTYGLAWDGEHLVTVSQRGLHFLTPSGRLVRSVATNYPLGSVGFRDGTYYLFESEVRGYDREHRFARVWPETVVLHTVDL